MGIDAETYAAAKGYTDKMVEGGGGTLDYEALRNHPSINGNELVGNKSSKQLGIQNLFTGTTAEWAQLTTDQKAQYTHVCFTDDTSEGSDGDMKKSVYDSDLAVANAGGIGAFVGDAVSGKVDKVEGKGLSTNDYDNTEKGKVADNTSAIEAMVNVTGACNLFAIDNPISLSNAEVANNGIINTDTDTMTDVDLMFRAYVNGSYVILTQDIPLTTGNKTYDITIPNNATKLQLKHNGVQRDISIEVPTVPAGNYKLTMTVVGTDPSVVGGFEITNIMLYDARLNPTGYVPYAMTNRELTEKVKNQPVFVDIPIGQDSPISINGNAFATRDVTLPTGKRAYACQYSSDSGYSVACITAINENGDGTMQVIIYNIYTGTETYKGHLKVACFDY